MLHPKTVSLVQLYKKLNTTWTLTVILVVTTLTQMEVIVMTINSALEMPTYNSHDRQGCVIASLTTAITCHR